MTKKENRLKMESWNKSNSYIHTSLTYRIYTHHTTRWQQKQKNYHRQFLLKKKREWLKVEARQHSYFILTKIKYKKSFLSLLHLLKTSSPTATPEQPNQLPPPWFYQQCRQWSCTRVHRVASKDSPTPCSTIRASTIS